MQLENSIDLQMSDAYMCDFEFGDDVEVIRKSAGSGTDNLDDGDDVVNREMEFDMESFG